MTVKSVAVQCLDDQQFIDNAYAFIQNALTDQPGPIVGFFAGELADVLNVSPGDILEWTKDLARRWWLEGQRFSNYGYLRTVTHVHGDAEYVEIEIHRDDCHKPLWQALKLQD